MTDVADPGPQLEQLACSEPGCDYVTKPAPVKGKGSARFLLGAHKYNAHKAAGSGKNSKAQVAARERRHEELAEKPVLGVVRDVAAEFSGKGAPTADELKRGLGRGLGLTSTAVASYAVETDPTIPEGPHGEAQRDAIVDELSLTQKSAEEIMAPIARLVAPTKLNKRYGRTVVENVDAVGAVAELVTLGLHWRRYFRQRRYRQGLMGPIDVASEIVPPAPPPPSPTPSQAAVPAVVPPAPAQPSQNGNAEAKTPAPTGGVIVTAEMVESMRRRGT